MSTSHSTVAVIEAGYAGVMAANRLCSSLTLEEASRVRVVMINRTGEFVERIRLHQVAAGTFPSAARPLSEMLHDDVDVVVGEVVAIDPDRKRVDIVTDSGPRLERYSTLIYAVGSVAAIGVPGVEQFGYLLANPDGAQAAREAIATSQPGQKVVVVGGGATGVEAAAEIAQRHPDVQVTLLCGDSLMGFLPDGARASIAKTLTRLGVRVHENVRVARVLEDAVELADGTPLAGDAVRPPASVGAHLRMACAVAIPLGKHAADTALAQLRGTEPQPLSAGFIMQCISLGRRKGYVQFVHADDTARRFHLAGSTGAKVKEMICKRVVTNLQKTRSKPDAYWSPAGPRPLEAESATV